MRSYFSAEKERVVNKVYFHVRPANTNDAVAIATIGYNCWHDSYKDFVPADFLGEINLQRQIERAETTIKQGGSILVASDADHMAVGYCAFGRTRDVSRPRENEIYSLYVSKHARSKGLGSILLFEAEHKFVVQKPILVRTLKANLRARKFYEDNGFRYQADRDGSFRNVADDVAYIKPVAHHAT
jgi:ribosomal protein S18 acetylase RimI-like enzyme